MYAHRAPLELSLYKEVELYDISTRVALYFYRSYNSYVLIETVKLYHECFFV